MNFRQATCQHCGTDFQAQRSTAKYCSTKCKDLFNTHKGKELTVRDDPLTNEVFMPTHGNQKFKHRENATKLRNRQVVASAKDMSNEFFSLIDTKAKRGFKKNVTAAVNLLVRWINVSAGIDTNDTTQRNIVRSVLTAPYQLNPQRGYRQLIKMKGLEKNDRFKHLQTSRQFQRARWKGLKQYYQNIHRMFHNGQSNFKTLAQYADDFCAEYLRCGIVHFAKFGRGFARFSFDKVNLDDLDLRVPVSSASHDSVFATKENAVVFERQAMLSVPASLLKIQKFSFGKAAA